MKIRIKGNSLRYRLTRTDVEMFAEMGYITEKTEFVGQALTYSLRQYNGDQLLANFSQNQIVLFMPTPMVDEWMQTERVGFESNSGSLYLLIEKDFKCLDNVTEDQSDQYPNPLAKSL